RVTAGVELGFALGFGGHLFGFRLILCFRACFSDARRLVLARLFSLQRCVFLSLFALGAFGGEACARIGGGLDGIRRCGGTSHAVALMRQLLRQFALFGGLLFDRCFLQASLFGGLAFLGKLGGERRFLLGAVGVGDGL